MARYKAVVSYDGSSYGGWQKQLNTTSIQEVIEQASVSYTHLTLPTTPYV